MEGMPLDVPNGGWWFEYDDINVHDVIPSAMVVHGCGLKSFILNPM
jgi:hypothetical protein